MRIKCIDNSGFTNELTIDKEYEVHEETSDYFRVITDKLFLGGFTKNRFRRVDHTDPTAANYVFLEEGKTHLTACGIAVKLDKYRSARIMDREIMWDLTGQVNKYYNSFTKAIYPTNKQMEDYKIVEALDVEIPQPPDGYTLLDGGIYRKPKKGEFYISEAIQSVSVLLASEDNQFRKFIVVPSEPRSNAPTWLQSMGDVITYGSVGPPLWNGMIGAYKPDEITCTNLCKEIEMVDISSANGKNVKAIRSLVARSATYWLLEPAKTYGMIAAKSVRYIMLPAILGAAGYAVYDYPTTVSVLKSCVPHVTISAPSILGDESPN
jgi:hypothetical protein